MSLKFIDFFAGIGGFRRGMELAEHKCVGFCEFDKFAVASYVSMHLLTDKQRKYIESIEAPLKKNGAINFNKRQKEILKEEYRNGEWYADDIRRVDAESLPKADVWCFGFPCQDISIAGKQLGFDGRRSSLFYAVTGLIRDLEEKDKPSYLLIENVKNLLSVNGGWDFAKLQIELDEIGYDAEWEVLNSKDFGVPQNRERVFVIGHLRGRSAREVFPLTREGGGDGAKNGLCCVGNVNPSGKGMNGSVYDSRGLAPSITTNKGEGPKISVKQIGNCMPSKTRENPNQGRIYDPSGISPTLGCMQGGNRQPMIPVSMTQKSCKPMETTPTLTARGPSRGRGNNSPVPGVMVREATKKGYAVATTGDSINLEQPNSKTRRGRVGKGVAQTLTTRCWQGTLDGARIRRLTPKECFRLQGWGDEYFNRAAMVNSDSQLYKQAGNGVTVTVIEAIARKLN